MIGALGENLTFLLGLPRSGTTLLSLMLGKHPDVYCPPEPWVMLAMESLGKVSARHPANSQVIGAALRDFLGEKGMIDVARCAAIEAYNSKLSTVGKSCFVDKTPRYYLILPFLQRVFPKAKFVWLIRNPVAVAASYNSTWGMDLAKLLADEIDSWGYYDLVLGPRRLMHFSHDSGGAVYWIRYEELVQNPDHQIRLLTDWLGLPPAEGLTSLDTTGAVSNSYAGDKKIVGTQRPHTDSLDAWERVLSPEDLQVLVDAIGAEIFQQLGYGGVLERLAQLGVYQRKPEITQVYVARAEELLSQRWQDMAAVSSAPPADHPSGLAPGALPERRDSALANANAIIAARDAELEQVKAHSIQINTEVTSLREAYGNLLNDREQWLKQAKYLETVVAGLNEPTFKKLILRAQKLLEVWIVGRPGLTAKEEKPLPKITVVTPCFNSADTIGDTIESVRAQNCKNLEYIVVDGGSTDGTKRILNDYQAAGVITKVISEPDNGMYDALRKGFAIATGQVFCYLNADDLFEPGGLQRVGEYFRDHKRVQAIYHEDTVQIHGWLFPNSRQVHCDTIDLMNGYMLFQDGVFWRRGLYDVIGGASSTLKVAGDYDLWLRMSRAGTLVLRPGHVSRFSIRHKQLSGDMGKYEAERTAIREQFWPSLPAIAKARIRAKHVLTTVKNFFHLMRRRHLYFPMDLTNLPPPVTQPPPRVNDAPRCPLTNEPQDRLLFSTPDTRYGDKAMNYVYYNSKSGVAMAYPPMSDTDLAALYEAHYSDADAKPIEPPAGSTSPYRKWFGGNRVDRALMHYHLFSKERRDRVSWKDPTASELLALVKRKFPATGNRVRFLDVGCFEGELLDDLKSATDWKLAGLEPNAKAVTVVREKGHDVWQANAGDAPYVVPQGMQFDLIFLGQTIEHLSEPSKMLRRLSLLLAPGGAIVLSTPNLDSKQIDLFGPTWAHWHIPYHRALYSRKSIKLLAEKSDLQVDKLVTHSNPYWSVMSLWLNQFGLAGAVPHGQNPPAELCVRATDLTIYSKYLWNWRGRGDYIYAVLSPRSA
ncbi:hypothetical protein BH10PLA1_BH10PLA1_09390 [soil metagenome]